MSALNVDVGVIYFPIRPECLFSVSQVQKLSSLIQNLPHLERLIVGSLLVPIVLVSDL